MEVKFYKGTGTPSTVQDGGIYFRTDTKIISLGVGTDLMDFGGNVTDASYNADTKVLTINKVDGDVTVSFADCASAAAMATALAALEKKIPAIKGSGAITAVTATTDAGTTATVGIKLDNSGNVTFEETAAGLRATASIAVPDVPVKDVKGKSDIKVTSADGVFTAETALDADITVMGVTVGAIGDSVKLTKGMTLSEVLKKILIKEIDVNKTNPTTVIKVTGVTSGGTYEVGTAISATLAHTYTDGKFTGQTGYSYSANAGCAEGATTYYRGSNAVTSPDAFTITEGTHTWKCTTAYGASTVTPKKNNGTNSSVNIAAGTATSGTFNINGRYKAYIGYSTETSGSAFDSAKIKALAAGNAWVNTSGSTTLKSSATSNGTSIVIACPESYRLTGISNSLGVSIMENFIGITKNASGAYVDSDELVKVDYTNGGTTTKYKVYVYPITSGAKVDYKDVIISK